MWVLLHGAPLNPTVWDDVRALLHAPTITPDLNRPFPAATLQRDLAAALLDQIADDDLTVVGHSLGGQVAIELALRAPERIRHLILACTRATPIESFGETAQAMRSGEPVDIEAGVRRWFTETEVDDAGPVVRYVRQRLEYVDPLHYAYTLDALVRYDRREALQDITVDTTVICGGEDPIASPVVMANITEALPHARLHIIDEWAHMSPFVHADRFAELLSAASRPSP